MEITTRMPKPPVITPLYKETIIQIYVPNELRTRVVSIIGEESYDPEQLYTIRIEKARKRRSLDANAYAWVLIGKLARVLKMKPVDVYRNIIADGGNYTIVPIRDDGIAEWVSQWEACGAGWICEDMGPCRNIQGYHNVRCFRGSSRFDSKQMSHFIDMIKQECDEQGIETMTPAELEDLKKTWK